MVDLTRRAVITRPLVYSSALIVPNALIVPRAEAFLPLFFGRIVVQRLVGYAAKTLYRNTAGTAVRAASRQLPRKSLRRRIVRTGNKVAEEGFGQMGEWAGGEIFDRASARSQSNRQKKIAYAKVEAKSRKVPGLACYANCNSKGDPQKPVLALNHSMLGMGLASEALAQRRVAQSTQARLLFPIETISDSPMSNMKHSSGAHLLYKTPGGSFETRTILSRSGHKARIESIIRRYGSSSETLRWDIDSEGQVTPITNEISVYGSRRTNRRTSRAWQHCESRQERLLFREECGTR